MIKVMIMIIMMTIIINGNFIHENKANYKMLFTIHFV